MSALKPSSVDAYLELVQPDVARQTLSTLRAIILDEVPEAEEKISYGVPTYKLNGFLASIGAFKNHCSFFPGAIVSQFASELVGYKISKGTIQFPHDKPLPEALVRKILRARVAENAAGRGE